MNAMSSLLFRFRPRSLTLRLDGRAIRARALVVLAANGPYWGYSIPLAPNAKETADAKKILDQLKDIK